MTGITITDMENLKGGRLKAWRVSGSMMALDVCMGKDDISLDITPESARSLAAWIYENYPEPEPEKPDFFEQYEALPNGTVFTIEGPAPKDSTPYVTENNDYIKTSDTSCYIASPISRWRLDVGVAFRHLKGRTDVTINVVE